MYRQPADVPADVCWIWSDRNPDAYSQVAQFRLTFAADEAASFTGFADTFYILWCNGVPLGMGPVTSSHAHPRLTTWDLSPYLRAGENVLALEVWFDGRHRECSDADPWQAGLIGWVACAEGTIPTGPRWKTRYASIYTQATPGQRAFGGKRIVIADFRGEPAGWQDSGFDDAAWQPATVVARHPDGQRTLLPSPIPHLTRTPRIPQALIDAGIARGGEQPVTAAEHVAQRMTAQTHESLARTAFIMACIGSPGEQGVSLPEVSSFTCPLALPRVDGEYFLTLDMGLQTSGNLWLDIDASEEMTIDVGYADHLQNGRVIPTLQGHYFADRLVIARGRQRVYLPHDRGFRYLQLTLSQPATLHEVRVDEHVYPHDDVRRFRCSDDTLNGVWELAIATLHQCSLYSHVDNARRERQGWGGPDLYAQMHGFVHAFGDMRLTRKVLEDYLDFFAETGFIPEFYPAVDPAVTWIPAHDLWFPSICGDYLRYADDRALAPALLQACEAVLAYYGKRTINGLYARAEDRSCRWAEWNLNGAEEISTWENLLAVAAWRAVAEMRAYLELPGADAAQEEAERLAAAINTHLWHPMHQALAQGTRKDGALVDYCGQLDNAFALLHDIVPAERREAVYRRCAGPSGTWPTNRSGWQGHFQGERVRHDPRQLITAGTPFTSSVCAQTMCACGHAAEAVQYIRYNFGAILDEGEGALWEMWPITVHEDISATCYSQAYGAHITATLIGSILGLTIDEPGGAKLTWRPNTHLLPWAEGRIDTKHGPVTVRWDADGLHYDAPAGVTLTVCCADECPA